MSRPQRDSATMHNTIKCGRQFRHLSLQRDAFDAEKRTVSLAFASEEPVERWFGLEVLDVSAGAMRMGRMHDGAPLLLEHDTAQHVGVIESVDVGADRRARAVARFGRSALAQQAMQDVADGIKRHVSVGYIVHRYALEKAGKDGAPDTYRAVDWEPLESSLVAVPADPTVGIGRAADDLPREVPVELPVSPLAAAPEALAEPTAATQPAPEAQPAPAASIRSNNPPQGNKPTMNPVQQILALGQTYAHLGGLEAAREYLGANAEPTLEAFQAELLKRNATPVRPAAADIGLTPAEVRRFSFVRAIHALANPGDRRAQSEAAFEREASEAVAKVIGRAAQGFFVPNEVLKRDLNVTTTTAGGHTVATNLLAANFIDLLRNRMALMGLGATMLSGLVGNIAIPRQTSGATAYWVAESGAPTESQQAFDQVTMTPRTVGAFTDVSRKLLLQSSIDVEAFIRSDLATVLALAIDLAGINGSGASNQPTGVLNTAGIGDVAGGTNGLAPTWAHIVELETDVAVANADIGTLGYLTNAKVRGKAKTVEKASSTAQFLWADGNTPLNGYRAAVSNQVPSDLTKGSSSGVCSAILFGNWADLVIGMWGSLDLMVDPYTGSTSGTVRVVALQDVDVAVRHAQSFSAMKDALTV
jgi:HK97 family phage major capsid protein